MDTIENITDIQAPVAKVRAAITTTDGHRGWWTPDCEVGARPGAAARFSFAGTMEVRFRIDRLDDRGIAMTCVGETDNPDWLGTQVAIEATPHAGGTRVTLTHSHWTERGKVYEMCVGGWRHFMDSLKAYVETGTGTPYGTKPQGGVQ